MTKILAICIKKRLYISLKLCRPIVFSVKDMLRSILLPLLVDYGIGIVEVVSNNYANSTICTLN